MKGIENGHHWLYDRKPEHKDCQFKQLFHSPDTLPEVYWYVHQTSILPLFHQIPLEMHLIGWLFFGFPLPSRSKQLLKGRGLREAVRIQCFHQRVWCSPKLRWVGENPPSYLPHTLQQATSTTSHQHFLECNSLTYFKTPTGGWDIACPKRAFFLSADDTESSEQRYCHQGTPTKGPQTVTFSRKGARAQHRIENHSMAGPRLHLRLRRCAQGRRGQK